MNSSVSAAVDFVTTEVIGNFLQTTSDEIALSFLRGAYSPNLKERWDVCAAIFDVQGRLVSLATYIPLHMGSMAGIATHLLKKFPLEAIQPGDVFIGNDPYACGGSHLPDMALITPFFAGGSILGFISVVGHHADVGGRMAGSSSATAQSVFEEGLRLPVVRLQEAGRLDQDVLDIIMLNSRTPIDREGDLRGQIGALNVGLASLDELCRRYPRDRVQQAMVDLLDHSEKRFRASIGRYPPAEWSYTDYLDDDGTGGEPVPVHVTVRIRPQEIEVDFTGTGPQVMSGFNAPFSATLAAVYYALKAFIDPGVSANAGYFRAIRVVAPEGCLVNPRPPSAVSVRANTCQVIADAIFGALSQADPDRAYAGCGAHIGLHMGGNDPRTGQYFVHNENICGGWGARADRDGMDAVHAHITNTANIPIEASEHEFPLVYVHYSLLPGSGGSGRFRGGLAVRRDIRITGEDVRISLRAHRHRIPAQGRNGGGNGGLGEVFVNPNTSAERKLPSTASGEKLEKGDVLSVRTAGGAGFGPPTERAPELRERDLREGKVKP